MSHVHEALIRAAESPAGDLARPALRPPPSAAALERFTEEGPERPDDVDRAPSLRPQRSAPDMAAPETPHRPLMGRAAGDFEGKFVARSATPSVSAEQYRSLATVLHQAQMDRGLKTVVVTSAVPREGKTLTVINLALTLTESYARRVLVIDADLRWPSVHRGFGLTATTGLSEALVGPPGELPVVEVSKLLHVLPAGRPEPKPLALLSSNRLQPLLDKCASRFDWVLVDTPPVGLLADAQLLTRCVHGVVFVIRAGTTPFAVVERAIAELGRECIIGTVLNGVDERRMPATALYDRYVSRR